MKSALIFPPQWFPSQPYLAIPTLKGYLEKQGYEVDQYDFNVESYDILLSRDYLEFCIDKIRFRLNSPAYTTEESEVKKVYRKILSDTGYLDSIFMEVEEAKTVLRKESLFFQYPLYKKAFTTLKVAMKLVSFAHFPTRLDLESLYMEGAPEDHLEGILKATQDSVTNPYYSLFKDRFLPKTDWGQYGLIGVSIIHVGQVIPALTWARFLRHGPVRRRIELHGATKRKVGCLMPWQPGRAQDWPAITPLRGTLRPGCCHCGQRIRMEAS